MWLCLNNAFLSIVEDPKDANIVIVRSRQKAHLENFVGDTYTITQTDYRDYRFRTFVNKFDLSKMLAKCADRIDYGNFKDSVKDVDLKCFYGEVWGSGIRNLDDDWFNRNRY